MEFVMGLATSLGRLTIKQFDGWLLKDENLMIQWLIVSSAVEFNSRRDAKSQKIGESQEKAEKPDLIWQGVVWIKIKGAKIHSFVLAMKRWFLCLLGLNMIVWNPIIQKKSKKMKKHWKTQKSQNCTVVHYSALQCTIVKRLNYSLQMDQIWPIMTQDDWLWLRMTYQGSGGHQGVQGAPGGARGH